MLDRTPPMPPGAELAVHTPPRQVGAAPPGRTIPALLDAACAHRPNARALRTRGVDGRWTFRSNRALRDDADRLAAALHGLGLRPGERAALWLDGGLLFTGIDMACAIAGLVDVPVLTAHRVEHLLQCLDRVQARIVFVHDHDACAGLLAHPRLPRAVEWIVVPGRHRPVRSRVDRSGPSRPEVVTLDDLLDRGDAWLEVDPSLPARMRAALRPEQPATVLFTSGTTGAPRGVVLSHENLTSNALASFAGLTRSGTGSDVVHLSFLPAAHAFERTILYGHLHAGHCIAFSAPDRLGDDLKDVRPTEMTAVPRVLEKLAARIAERGAGLTGARRRLFDWAFERARGFRHVRPDGAFDPRTARGLRHRVADALIYKRWRAALGGRLATVVCGGAPLRAELVPLFAAAGVRVLHGYGLTEASPIVAFNRIEYDRPGSAGIPLPGVDIAFAADGELWTRGPHVMQGYLPDPAADRSGSGRGGSESGAGGGPVRNGWLATGDLGHVDDDGFLWITGRKKELLRLSTGRDVAPLAFEQAAAATTPGIAHALLLGQGQKHPAALLFVDPAAEIDPARLVEAVARGNAALPPWAEVRAWHVVRELPTVANGLLTPTQKLRRGAALERYRAECDALFDDVPPAGPHVADAAHLARQA